VADHSSRIDRGRWKTDACPKKLPSLTTHLPVEINAFDKKPIVCEFSPRLGLFRDEKLIVSITDSTFLHGPTHDIEAACKLPCGYRERLYPCPTVVEGISAFAQYSELLVRDLTAGQ